MTMTTDEVRARGLALRKEHAASGDREYCASCGNHLDPVEYMTGAELETYLARQRERDAATEARFNARVEARKGRA